MQPIQPITNVRMVRNLVEPDKPWRLLWQVPTMPAPAFEYYATKAEADEQARKVSVVPCRECGKPSATGLHPSCASFREWIRRGGTLD